MGGLWAIIRGWGYAPFTSILSWRRHRQVQLMHKGREIGVETCLCFLLKTSCSLDMHCAIILLFFPPLSFISALFTNFLLSSFLSLDFELGTVWMSIEWTFTLFMTIVIDKFPADEWIEYVVTDRLWRLVPLMTFHHLCGYLHLGL